MPNEPQPKGKRWNAADGDRDNGDDGDDISAREIERARAKHVMRKMHWSAHYINILLVVSLYTSIAKTMWLRGTKNERRVSKVRTNELKNGTNENKKIAIFPRAISCTEKCIFSFENCARARNESVPKRTLTCFIFLAVQNFNLFVRRCERKEPKTNWQALHSFWLPFASLRFGCWMWVYLRCVNYGGR